VHGGQGDRRHAGPVGRVRAPQLGHDARLTLTTYGHVIDELDEEPPVAADDAIRAARRTPCAPGVSAKTAHGDAR
jgi:hypothetical protein